jgi:hypothetical protein
VLPLGSWDAGGGLGYATSRDGSPTATDLLPGRPSGATRRIVGAIGDAERGDTARLGRLLAPMAVRYVVLPSQLASGDRQGAQRPPPATLTHALGSQLDLRLLPSDPGTVVYENIAWGPGRELVPGPVAAAGLPDTLDSGADLAGAAAVLGGKGPVRFAGRLPSGGTVLVSEAPSSRWALSVDGQKVPRADAFGVANAYSAVSGGSAVLAYHTPVTRYAAVLLELALWVAAVALLRRLRRRPDRVAGTAP